MPAYGRLQATDERDKNHLLRSVTKRSLRLWRYWPDNAWWGDQNGFPQCVGYGWAHWIEDGPVGHHGVAPILDPVTIYNEAQKVDEWPGEGYPGTSVRAGAKVLQARGFISSYLWGWTLNDLLDDVLENGPSVIGTNWYDSMDQPDSKGFIRISPGAGIAGGHCYIINGVNRILKKARMKNSWNRTWGLSGRAWMTFDDLDRLIHEQGEVCRAVEIASPLQQKLLKLQAA